MPFQVVRPSILQCTYTYQVCCGTLWSHIKLISMEAEKWQQLLGSANSLN